VRASSTRTAARPSPPIMHTGALLQSILHTKLRERITGSGAAEVRRSLKSSASHSADARMQLIDRIRHDTGLIAHLDAPTRAAAVATYADALRAVFACQAASAALSLIACAFIQEAPLPCVSARVRRYVRGFVLMLWQGHEGGGGGALSPTERGSACGRARDGGRGRRMSIIVNAPALQAWILTRWTTCHVTLVKLHAVVCAVERRKVLGRRSVRSCTSSAPNTLHRVPHPSLP
jgi:hypothetical protein